jgi:aryl-alcohol dehydrogenase-like predicted oxidoreductase
MKRNKIGQSTLTVSELGLGCMTLGTNKEKARSIIDIALDAGINYLDTADLYDFGINEEIVGASVKGRREDIIISTKGGNRRENGKNGWFWDPSKAYIKEAVKESLRRLGIDYIDLYQLHGGTADDPIDETIEAFEELVQEGLIRYYGISSIRPNVIREFVERSNIVSVMMQYSLLDRRPEEEMLTFLANSGVSVIPRGPLAKGLLTSEWQRKLAGSNGFLDYSPQELEKTITDLINLRTERSLQATALQYVLANTAVATAIPGASNIYQIRENVKAILEPALSEDCISVLRAVTKDNKYDAHR